MIAISEYNEKRKLIEVLKDKKMKLSLMEDYTGGLLTSIIGDIDESVIEGSYIDFTTSAKIQDGFKREVVEDYGIYSIESAIEMARVCKERRKTEIGIGITSSFKGAFKDCIDKEDGLSMIELNKESSMTFIYFAIDTPDGVYADVIEIPECFVPQKNETLKHCQKQYVVNLIIKKLVTLIDISNIENIDKTEEKMNTVTNDILKVVGLVTLGVSAIFIKKKMMKK